MLASGTPILSVTFDDIDNKYNLFYENLGNISQKFEAHAGRIKLKDQGDGRIKRFE
jgi:hypothetical protein